MFLKAKRPKHNLTLVLAAFACLTFPSTPAAETLKIGGVGGSMGSINLLAAAFEDLHPDVRVAVIQRLGSGGGIMAVARGVIDIAITGRPLQGEEQKLGLTVTEYARTPLVFAVRSDSPISGLSRDSLIGMIRGDVTTWPDGRRARAVLRPLSDSETLLIANAAPDVGRAIEAALAPGGRITALTAQDAADAIESIPGAFGITTLGLIQAEQRPLKALALDGVFPNEENCANGSYPFVATYSMITGSEPAKVVRGFIEFVLSAQGRRILEDSGHFVKRGER